MENIKLSKTLLKGNVKKYEGEYNGCFQTLFVISDTNNVLYTASCLEYLNINDNTYIDANLTKWKAISNETFSKIEDEMRFITKIDNDIIGKISTFKKKHGIKV